MSDESNAEYHHEADWERKLERFKSYGMRADGTTLEYDELEHLKEQYAEGKLTLEQFEERAEELIVNER